MQQRTKSKTHSERAWEAYQKEKRLRKMRQEEQIRRYKFILAVGGGIVDDLLLSWKVMKVSNKH